MESKFINRYNTFCKSLKNLSKSVTANPKDDFVLEGTVQNFNLTFDISWKVMKDLLVNRFGVLDYAVGSPRENLQKSFTVGLIQDDIWLKMLKVRNQLSHDYDGSLAEKEFYEIIHDFYPVFVQFQHKAEQYCVLKNIDHFE